MARDTMLLASKNIVLSLGLCQPPDQMGAKFCYVRSLSVVSKCLDIPTLFLERHLHFLNYKSEIKKNPKIQKNPNEKIQNNQKKLLKK